MTGDMDRRDFLRKSVAASTGAALGMSAAADGATKSSGPLSETGKNGMPMGRIGDVRISRLISGGNLIGGWSHSRDLRYVSQLMLHYNTPQKIMDTMEIMEQQGINTIIADLSKPHLMDIMDRYWNERGGSIQWITQAKASVSDLTGDIKRAVDHGACAAYMHGGLTDRWVMQDRLELLGKCVDYIKKQGIPGGIGAHSLETVMATEAGGLDPDFYMKTIHHKNYWSAQRPDQEAPVIKNRADNYWARTPERTIEFMRNLGKPWIGFKVLAAGAIHPKDGFQYAFESGADFICVGMFDWQVKEDVKIAKRVVRKVAQSGRPRAWYA